MTLKAAQNLMTTIKTDFFDVEKTKLPYKYVGVLKNTPVSNRTTVWVRRNSSGGLVPIIAPGGPSPLAKKGTYREFKNDAIDTREAVQFTREELKNIVSKDRTVRIDEKSHIKIEVTNQMRRSRDTRELVANSILARGVLRYSSMQPGHAMKIDMTFPIKTRTASILWSDLTNAVVVTDMDTWLNAYQDRVGKVPDRIRMTSRMFNNYIKKNTEVKGVFTSSWQGQKAPGGVRTLIKDERGGFLTKDEVVKANGWPPIEFYDKRYEVQYTAKSAATAGNNVVIELKEGTFGFFVGTKVFVNFGYDANGGTTWAEEATVTEVNHGKHIVIDTLDTTIAADIIIAARPFFFPENRILFESNAEDNEFVEPDYGIEMSGSDIVLPEWRGLKADVFMGGIEPNLAVFRRVWDSFGMIVHPDNNESIQVI